jgi:hypothetical protein
MNTAPLLIEEFATSVLAVPPLARRADLSLDVAQNQRLVRHIEAGGHRILLYGGNANLYHCGLQDYAQMLGMLASCTLDGTRVIPAIGPDFGKMMDQARLLRGSGYRTAMVLPMQGFTSPEGVAEGISRFVDAADMPVTMYLKSEQAIDIARIGQLVDGGRILAIKYAVVRDDPAIDPYLQALVERIGAHRIVSGMGERPVPVHLAQFGFHGDRLVVVGARLQLGDLRDPPVGHVRIREIETPHVPQQVAAVDVTHRAVGLTERGHLSQARFGAQCAGRNLELLDHRAGAGPPGRPGPVRHHGPDRPDRPARAPHPTCGTGRLWPLAPPRGAGRHTGGRGRLPVADRLKPMGLPIRR